MRKKLLSNNEITSISKGGILYRPGEIPVLTKSQAEQAKLVAKLPQDFPIASWENMGTKQQLQQMKYSGLNAQEQWSLLNSNVPLSALDQYNQAQTQSGSTMLAARVAASLVNTSAQVAAAKAQAAVGKPTVSTPLQTSAQLRKYDVWQEEYAPRYYGKATSGAGAAIAPKNTLGAAAAIKPVNRDGQSGNSNGDDGDKDTIWEKIAALWNKIFPRAEKQEPTHVETLTTVPPSITPRMTPTPSPKPTPTPTPKPTANLNMIKQFVADMRSQKNPFYLKYSQESGARSDCSTQVFDFYSLKGEKNPLLGAQHETCKSYYEKLHIPPETFIESGGTVWSTVPRDIAKGDTKVPDNWQSTTQFGDMVIWMKDPKYDSGKRLIIESYDDLHIGLCLGNEQMLDRAQWEENNPNGYEEGLFARGLDTINSSYEVILIIRPGDEARLTPDDIYNYLLEHQD